MDAGDQYDQGVVPGLECHLCNQFREGSADFSGRATGRGQKSQESFIHPMDMESKTFHMALKFI